MKTMFPYIEILWYVTSRAVLLGGAVVALVTLTY